MKCHFKYFICNARKKLVLKSKLFIVTKPFTKYYQIFFLCQKIFISSSNSFVGRTYMPHIEEKNTYYSLISSDSAKESLFEKLFDLEAFSEITAIPVDKLELSEEEDIAFDESVLEEEIIVFQEREIEYCYLVEYYKPTGSIQKGIRRTSLPLIVICLILMIFFVLVFISQIRLWL